MIYKIDADITPEQGWFKPAYISSDEKIDFEMAKEILRQLGYEENGKLPFEENIYVVELEVYDLKSIC